MSLPPDPAAIAERARRMGPLPYSDRGVSRAVPLPDDAGVAAWEAEVMDRWWLALDRPDPFTVVEIAAGTGARARQVLRLGPLCLEALRYVLVEPDPALRARHQEILPIESPVMLAGPVIAADGDDEEPRPVVGIGPRFASLAELPSVDGPAGLFAVGWVGRLPSDRIELRDGAWWEIRLAAAAGGIEDMPIPLDTSRAAEASALVSAEHRSDGSRYAVLAPAVAWLAGALRMAPSGWVAVLDRWTPATEPLPPGEDPALALDQLAVVRRPEGGAPAGVLPPFSAVCWRLG